MVGEGELASINHGGDYLAWDAAAENGKKI
jgi:hypothetical protein